LASVNANERLIETFYRALGNADIDGIRACYSPDILYSDPIFRELRGERAVLMWEMLLTRGGNVSVTFDQISASQRSGSGHWVAQYRFNGRPVVNSIDSSFVFADDGRIVEHHDTFSVRKWAAQALGPAGKVVGWAPPLKSALHRTSARRLDSYQQKKGGD
jgi:ketosteroid isomerase-like protein